MDAEAAEREVARLRAQASSLWQKERENLAALGVRPGMRHLDLGCGPAANLRQVGAEFAPSFALGVDRDVELLRRAQGVGVRVLRADAGRLPFAPRAFDLVTARFLLRHVPSPTAVIAEARRVVAPGGLVLVTDGDDDSWALDPEPPGWRQLTAALGATARRRGGEPGIGRRLRGLLLAAGLADVHVRLSPVSTEDIAPRVFVEMLLAPDARPIDADLLSKDRAATLWAEVRAWAARPDAFGWVLGVTAVGRAL